jgi:hypothetical protein
MGAYQIDTYNESGKTLEMIHVNGKGDTTQWWKYEINSEGYEIRNYSIINSTQFDLTHILDTAGRVIASISTIGNRSDTIAMPLVNYNEFGDPESHFLYDGTYAYIYDSLDQKIKETFIIDEGDTVDVTIYKYDSSGNQLGWTSFENDTLVLSQESTIDSKGNTVKNIKKNGNGDLVSIEHFEYTEDGNISISHGINYYGGEAENWEMILEKVSCSD